MRLRVRKASSGMAWKVKEKMGNELSSALWESDWNLELEEAVCWPDCSSWGAASPRPQLGSQGLEQTWHVISIWGGTLVCTVLCSSISALDQMSSPVGLPTQPKAHGEENWGPVQQQVTWAGKGKSLPVPANPGWGW